MAQIQIVDKYRIRFHKPHWSDEELFLIRCLELQMDNMPYVVADVRMVFPNALKGFMEKCFSYYLLSPSNQRYKEGLYNRIRQMYNNFFKEFLELYYPKTDYEREMFNHQKRALAMMVHKKHTLLSFEQGLGKTITSATISKILRVRRTIVVSPALPKWNWFHDMTDDWGYDPLLWSILDSKKSKSMYAFRERFVVVNYEMINKHFQHLSKDFAGHIIIDECQKIKNHRTNNFKAVEKLVKCHQGCRITLLSGTPWKNRINDFFAYLKLTGHELGKNHKRFRETYLITSSMRGGQKIMGSKNIDDLRLKVSNFMIRKETDECIDLPDLLFKKCYFDVGELDKEYDEILMQMYEQKYGEAESQSEAKDTIKKNANLHSLNRIVTTSKVPKIKELIDAMWENERKVIVFAGYTAPLEMLKEMYGDKAVLINGSVGSHKRQQLIDKFKTDPECHVFLGNMVAAGVGVNLVNARDVIFMNFPFTPDDLEQAYKRAHRIGQKKSVNVHYTFAQGTIDEHVYGIVADKSREIDQFMKRKDTTKSVYGSHEEKIFNSLVNDFAKKKGLNVPESSLVSIK